MKSLTVFFVLLFMAAQVAFSETIVFSKSGYQTQEVTAVAGDTNISVSLVAVTSIRPDMSNTGPRTNTLVNMTPLEALNSYGTTVTCKRITGSLWFTAPTYWQHIGPDPRGKVYTFVDCEIQGEVCMYTATDYESGNGTLTPDNLMVTLNMSYCRVSSGISSAAGYKGTIDHCSFQDKSRWAVNDTYAPAAAAPGHTFHVIQNCYFWAPYQAAPSHYEVMQNFTKVAGLTVINCTFEMQGGPFATSGVTGIINGAFAPDNLFDHCYFLWDGAAAAYYSVYANGSGTFRNCFIEDGTAYLYPGSQCTFTNCRSYTTGNLLTLP